MWNFFTEGRIALQARKEFTLSFLWAFFVGKMGNSREKYHYSGKEEKREGEEREEAGGEGGGSRCLRRLCEGAGPLMLRAVLDSN